MSLTDAQIGLLGNPFKLEEHGFKNGNVFIRKSAIRARLDKVDPGWQLTPPELVTVNGDVVVMRGGLTIGGVTRYDIGTHVIQKTRKKSKDSSELVPLSDFEIATNTANAFKAAVSAILSRAFVQFGGGEYLKDMTLKEKSEITDHSSLKPWLEKLPVYTPPPPPLPVQPPLTADDLRVIEDLSQKYLGLSAEKALASLELPKWNDFCRMFPNLDGALKAIANRLADQKRAVTVYQATTKVASNKERSLYLSLSFGFADVAVFEREMADVFPTLAIIGDWKHLDAERTFNPPLRVILNRNERGYPKANYAEQMDTPEEERQTAGLTKLTAGQPAPLS